MADPGPHEDLRSGSVTFIGTATVILRYAGFTILTDPNFLHQGEHAKLGYGLRSERLTEPAMALEDLPALDFVVLSHHHGDHFDERVVAELDKSVRIITTRHAARKLDRQGFLCAEALDTWESVRIEKGTASVTVTALPAKHAPQPLQAMLPPVMGSMLEFADAGGIRMSLYISGDTLLHDGLGRIRDRYPEIHLALLHLGGTRILGILLTMDAQQGVEALETLRPRHAIPIHHSDYTVFRSTLAEFKQAVERRVGLATTLHYIEPGESYDFALADLHR
jgi:L-ascorbate metabolism protein UlaG (beta-lactamase superfamily)